LGIIGWGIVVFCSQNACLFYLRLVAHFSNDYIYSLS
jgi:hypothetical protein